MPRQRHDDAIPPDFRPLVGEQRCVPVGRHRLAQEETLYVVAFLAAQELDLPVVLDSLSDDGKSQALG